MKSDLESVECYAGETAEEIIQRKQNEIKKNGWTLWSFQFRNTLDSWYQEIEKMNPESVLTSVSKERVLVILSESKNIVIYHIPVGETIPKKIPEYIQIPYPMGSKTSISALLLNKN